jgi:1,4-alpha-glucan branching enzyme
MAITKKATKGASVTFAIEAPKANKVMLAGSFNNWDHTSMPLKRTNKEGLWAKDMVLNPGKYEYKFVVDGNWINDPRNRKTIRNPFGTENSLIEVA